MSSYFFEKALEGPISSIAPKNFLGKGKEKFAIVDRFSEQIFREKGWNEKLDYENIKLDSIEDLFQVSTFLSSVTSSLDKLQSLNIATDSNKQDYAEILSKSQEQFQGYFVQELQKRIGVEIPKTMKQQWQIQNPAKNLKENLNPLNIFTSGSVNSILNFLSDNNDDVSVEDYQKKVDQIFKKIWDVNNSIQPLLSVFNNNIVVIKKNALENNRANIYTLEQNFRDLQNVFNDTFWVSSENNMYEQCIDIKKILNNIIDNFRVASIYDNNITKLDNEIETFKNAKSDLAKIITSDKKILNSIEANYSSIDTTTIKKNEVSSIPFKINELFFVEDDQFEILYSRYYKDSRNSYKISGHSSVNQSATTFVKKTKTRKDFITEVDESVPTNHSFAPKYVGQGDKLGDSESVETVNTNKKIGPIQDKAYDDLLDCICDNRTSTEKGENFHLGKFGISANTLIENGYVKPGTSTKNLKQEKNWIGKDGIKNEDEFLSDENAQDKIIQIELKILYKKMINSNIIQKNTPINQVGAAIAVAYKFNTEAVNNVIKNLEFKSGNGDDAKRLFEKVSKNIDKTIPDNEVTDSIKKLGGNESDQLEALVSSNTVSDLLPISIPIGGGAHEYPHNSVRETESGHFVEFDDTPGSERINERHRTGTGYEVLPDGGRKVVVTGDSYHAVFGDDYILVGGNCNISVFGDASFNVSGDSNQKVGGDMNVNVSGNYNLNVEGNKSEKISGTNTSQTKGDRIDSVSGFYSLSTEGDLQIEGASVSIIARDTDIDIVSPNFARIRAINTQLYGLESLTVAAKKTALHGSDEVQITGDSLKTNTNYFGAKSSTMDLDTNGAVNARVTQAVVAGGIGALTPLNINVVTDNNLASELDTFVNDVGQIFDVAMFEAIDTSSTQAYTDNSSRSVQYYSTTNAS